MSTTEISTPQVAKATTEIDDLINSWKKEMDSISDLNDTLMAMWKGNAREKYLSLWNEDLEKFSRLMVFMNQYNSALKEIVNEYSAGEEEAVNVVSR